MPVAGKPSIHGIGDGASDRPTRPAEHPSPSDGGVDAAKHFHAFEDGSVGEDAVDARVDRVMAEPELGGVEVGGSDVAHADPAVPIGASDDPRLTFAEWAGTVEKHGDDGCVRLRARLVRLHDGCG